MKRILFILFVLLGSVYTAAGQTSTFAYKRGADISPSTVFNAQSEYYTAAPAIFYTNSEKMRVKLANIDLFSVPNYYPECWQLTVTYNVTIYPSGGGSSVLSGESLTINYENNNGSRIHQDIAFKEYNGKRATVSITGFDFRTKTGCTTLGTASGTFPTTGMWSNVNWNEIELSIQYIADRTYHTNLSTTSISHTPAGTALCGETQSGFTLSADNTATLQWAGTNSAVRYDLEWVFIDLPGSTPFDARYEFNWENATRISTTTNSFVLPLAYPRGKFVYRYRVVRKVKNSSGDYYLLEEDWSRPGGLRGQKHLDATQNDGSMPNGDYFNYCGMELDKSWTYGSGYSENALRGEGLSFFDAMGRTRQSLGFVQTDGHAVVSEMYYDREGRPAAASMPVPLSSQGARFYNNFGAGFDYPNDYEANPSGFTGLPSGHKASEFYSTSSPFASSFPQIPSAQGYALSQVKRLNNGDALITEVSAPGPDHKLGGEHSQTATESGVLQEELDRVFGNEIGYAAHYKKVVSKDANGQRSVSYIDGSGRPVATALLGEPAITNVEQLASSPQAITVNVLDQWQLQPNGTVLSQKEMYMAAGDVRSFTYSLGTASQYLPCLDLTFGCLYDVEIQIFNQEDEPQILNVSGNNTTLFALNGITSDAGATFSFTVPADGSYRIVKRTRLHNGFLAAALDSVEALVRQGGIGPLNPCVPVEAPDNNCADCAANCSTAWSHTLLLNGNPVTVYDHPDGNTYTSLPLLADAYAADVLLDVAGKIGEVQALIAQCVQDCQADSNVIVANACFAQRMLLLKDLSPGGQYFDNHPLTYGQTAPDPADQYAWLNEFIPGTVRDDIMLLNPAIPGPEWENITPYWQPGMAELLLPYHPEYCKYVYYCEYVNNEEIPLCGKNSDVPNHWGSSAAYDTYIHSVQSDSAAFAMQLFDPLNGNSNHEYEYHIIDAVGKFPEAGTPADYAGVCDYADPFFQNPLFSAELALMQQHLQEYLPNPFGGGYFSIWDMLDPATILSGNTFNMADPGEASLHAFLSMLDTQFSTGTLTRYQFFRAYYMFYKESLKQQGYTSFVSNDLCMSCTDPVREDCMACGTGDCPDCYLSALDQDNDGQTDPGSLFNSPCGGEFDYSGFQIRYPYNGVFSAAGIGNGEALYCENTCEGFALNWINQMKAGYTGCINWMDSTSEALLKQYLIDECMLACQATPPGSGTPDYSNVALVLQSFIEDYNMYNSPKILACPDLQLNPGDTTERYTNCQCVNIAEILESSGALVYTSIPDLNPLKIPWYLVQGYDIAELLNPTDAVTFINERLDELEYGGAPLSWSDIYGWLELCPQAGIATLPGLPEELSCARDSLHVLDCAAINAEANQAAMETEFQQALQAFLNQFAGDLQQGCLQGIETRESLHMTYVMGEYHHTLYYYDRAGNLIKTVPPQGVNYLSNTDIADAMAYRNSSHSSPTYAYTPSGSDLLLSAGFKRPDHFLVTNYRYNSLNQLTASYTPDEGQSLYLYDEHSRLVLSQNARQAATDHYSYLRYDHLGRIYESGELSSSAAPGQKDVQDAAYMSSFFAGTAASRNQVTLTLYNETQTTTGLSAVLSNHVVQRRNAVMSSLYFESTPDVNFTNYLHATHYQYDVHGNAEKVVQDFPFLNQFYARFAITEYSYNLVNGQIKEVAYNNGKKDQYFHRYTYDADGRVTRVESSRDRLWWDVDARYFYNPLGQLHREEKGDTRVQGLDYVYTLHGMLKGINGSVLHPGMADPGRDGLGFGLTAYSNNIRFARDAMGFTLSYYEGDYIATGGSNARAAFSSGDIFSGSSGALMPEDGAAKRGFWNGNIAAVSTALTDGSEVNQDVLTQVYVYDVLMRLKSARSFSKNGVLAATQDQLEGTGLNNNWSSVSETQHWRSDYGYDANGNIRSLKRYDQNGLLMDDLSYTYEEPSARLKTNRLLHVRDAVSSSPQAEDFEVTAAYSAGTPTYMYDATGNLAKDRSEDIDTILWDVYGKLKKVDRSSSSSRPDIEFYYNSAGQRIMKIVKPNGGTGTMSSWKYMIWAYDLGGNVMAEYGVDYLSDENKYTLNAKAHFLYGAGRLGKDLRDSTGYLNLALRPAGAYTEVQSCSSCATATLNSNPLYRYGNSVVHTRQLGYKQFELSNHTGNILSVVTDRKNAVDIGIWVPSTKSFNTGSTDNRLDYYVADVVEVTDYYPGGMPMPGRSVLDMQFQSFKWGHNGQYNDDEIYGKGNTQMAEFWEYDARLMRRWNTDPMAHAGQSLYEAFYSNPIAFADPLGLKPGGPGKKGESSTSDESINMSTYCSDCDKGDLKDDKGKFIPHERSTSTKTNGKAKNGGTDPITYRQPDGNYHVLPANAKVVLAKADDPRGLYKKGDLLLYKIDGHTYKGQYAPVSEEYKQKTGRENVFDGYFNDKGDKWAGNTDWAEDILYGMKKSFTFDFDQSNTNVTQNGVVVWQMGTFILGVFDAAYGLSTAIGFRFWHQKTVPPKLLNQFNSVESLLEKAGPYTEVKVGLQGSINGDHVAILKAITQNAQKSHSGRYILKDGTNIGTHISSTTGEITIDINRNGQIFKIRVNP